MKESSEEKIKQILKSKINIPSGYVDAINTAFIKKGKSNHFIKILTTTCAGIILTSGIVLAGYNIYQKIWKEPEMVKNSDIEKSLENKEISKEDQEKLITTEEAKKKSLEILNALGYEELKIEEAELKNSNNTIYFIYIRILLLRFFASLDIVARRVYNTNHAISSTKGVFFHDLRRGFCPAAQI